jgi:hypothetical protein
MHVGDRVILLDMFFFIKPAWNHCAFPSSLLGFAHRNKRNKITKKSSHLELDYEISSYLEMEISKGCSQTHHHGRSEAITTSIMHHIPEVIIIIIFFFFWGQSEDMFLDLV